jgi:sarcosine oxidase gamma subunit
VAQLVEVEARAVGELAKPRPVAMVGVLAPHAITRTGEQQPRAMLGDVVNFLSDMQRPRASARSAARRLLRTGPGRWTLRRS